MPQQSNSGNKQRFWSRIAQSRVITAIRDIYARFAEAQQVRMADDVDGLPFVVFLGIICGLISGGIIIAFRLLIEGYASHWIGIKSIESFESLEPLTRLLLCVGGALVVGLLLHFLKPATRQVGVLHVIERLEYHQGYLPFKNALVQFITATISLISGQSIGREGPSIHLGATSSSILGRLLRAPNNSVRTLIGCGVAAAIAAAFNTPLAGVIFAMEVVLMEYTILGFTPVILAAVSATTLTHAVFGSDTAFTIPALELHSFQEIPIVALMGALIGCLSAFFISSTLFFTKLFSKRAIWFRAGIAGCITGLIALFLPEVMGTGYDTVNHLMVTQLSLSFVLVLILAKTITTASAVGLGIPAGLIGPVLFIGASAGSGIGILANNLIPDVASASFYTLLGMAAMMAATLQAPLAALIYLLELTGNQSIILPGMTAVISALLVSRIVFKKPSVYRLLMLNHGLDYRNSPLSQALRRIGVASVMERGIMQQNNQITYKQAEEILKAEPNIILISNDDRTQAALLPATDLAHYINTHPVSDETEAADASETETINLFEIPAKRRTARPIKIIATLQEAHEIMQTKGCDSLYVTGAHGAAKNRIYGIVTREHVESSYRV